MNIIKDANNIEKQAALRNLYRLTEEKRKERIFDPKIRTIGINVEELNKQTDEKKKMKDVEIRNNKHFEDITRCNMLALERMERKVENDRKQKLKELNLFRKTYQKPECASEFDLNDPNRIKNELPPRISDDDPRCGVSSLQIFEGEDLNRKTRLSLQQEQLTRWYDAQINERKKVDWQKREADLIYKQNMELLCEKMDFLSKAEIESRKLIDKSTLNYNQAIARKREERRNYIDRKHQALEEAEKNFNIFGDFLSENPDKAISALGPHRINPMEYKGMSSCEKEKIYHMNNEIIQQRKKLEEEKRKSEDAYAEEIKRYDRVIQKIDSDINDIRRKRDNNNFLENKRLAEEQNYRIDILNKEAYKSHELEFKKIKANPPGDKALATNYNENKNHDSPINASTKSGTEESTYVAESEYYNGSVFDNYSWNQTIKDANLIIKIPVGLKAKDLKVDIKKSEISIQNKSNNEIILKNKLSWDIKADSYWSFDSEKSVLSIEVEKCQECWWENFFVDEKKLDTTKLDCSRPMSDIDDEGQAKIHQLLHEQHLKRTGQVTDEKKKINELISKSWENASPAFHKSNFNPLLKDEQSNSESDDSNE